MTAEICCRCGRDAPQLAVIERGRSIDVCRDCVRVGDDLHVETPAGDAVAAVEPGCLL